MKKRIHSVFCFILILSMVFLSSCQCNHEWIGADCTTARTCIRCDKTIGKPLGHSWLEATCTEGKTCSACGRVESVALGHTWQDLTCTKPETCSVCGQTRGSSLGHILLDPTCTDPYICTVCGETKGKPLGHRWLPAMDQSGVEGRLCYVCKEYEPVTLDWTPLTQCECTYISNEETHKNDVVVGDWKTRVGTLPESLRFWVSNKENYTNTEYCVYRIRGNYKTLSGLISIGEQSEKFASMQVKIYLDDVLAFESITLSESSKDDSFSLDVSGVDLVRIVCTTSDIPFAYCVVSASVY